MNILVVTKSPVRFEDRAEPTWLHVGKSHNVLVEDPLFVPGLGFKPDAIVSMGVTIMDQTFQALKYFPEAHLFCYNWDCYEWVWTRPRKEEMPGTPGFLDYKRYGELLKMAKEVWVPSACTGRRTTQWWGLKNWHVVKTAIPIWHHPNVRDDGYVLCCLREIPDPWWGMFERCCTELGIPFRSTRHECSEVDYRDAIAGCRFICAPLYELSTGGLSLIEAHWHGKPVLLSDSEWNGGRDYLGNRALYFKHGDEADFKAKLQFTHEWAKHLDDFNVVENRRWIAKHYSAERMGDDIIRRLEL